MTLNTRALLSLFLAMVLTAPWPGPVCADGQERHYILDLSDAEVGFSVSVLGVFHVSGRFDQVQGGLLFSEACTAESIAFSIQTASISTNNRLRDRIIRGPALLNSRNYPVIAFTSTRIVSNDGRPGLITGMLDMNGKTRQVSFLIEPPQQVTGDPHRPDGYQAIASISRADFNIPSPMIGTSDTVHIRVSVGLREETLRLASSTTPETAP